jgi:hypothetical protein
VGERGWEGVPLGDHLLGPLLDLRTKRAEIHGLSDEVNLHEHEQSKRCQPVDNTEIGNRAFRSRPLTIPAFVHAFLSASMADAVIARMIGAGCFGYTAA